MVYYSAAGQLSNEPACGSMRTRNRTGPSAARSRSDQLCVSGARWWPLHTTRTMEALLRLSLLCVAMLVGSFVAGYVPLACTLSPRKLHLVTTTGVGVLVGTALIVIIPEGIHTVYGVHRPHVPMHALPAIHGAAHEEADHAHHHHEHGGGHAAAAAIGAAAAGAGAGGCPEPAASSKQIGAALAFGFVFQLFVDRLIGGAEGGHSHSHGGGGGSSHHGHSHGHRTNSGAASESALELGAGVGGTAGGSDGACVRTPREMTVLSPRAERDAALLRSAADPDDDDASAKKERASAAAGCSAAFVGILVHAAVDGVALGAASFSQSSALEFIVFMAIMLHKACGALRAGWTRAHARARACMHRLRRHLALLRS